MAASRFMGNSAAASAEAEKKEEISKAQTESQAADRITARAAPRVTADTSRARGTMERQVADVSDIVEQAMPDSGGNYQHGGIPEQ